jgi:hypothetical protein
MAKPNLLDKNRADVAQIFLVWMGLMGDSIKTAAALNLEPAQVEELAASEGWADKIRRVSVMSKSGRPGDYERSVNRCLNFVQVQCIRQNINRMLAEISALTNEELLSRACVRTRDGGQQLSAKIFLDLASAAEACQRMSYMALGDSISERGESDGGTGKGHSSNDLHAAIIASLSNPSEDPGKVSQLLIEEANAEAQKRATVVLPFETSAIPTNSVDNAE